MQNKLATYRLNHHGSDGFHVRFTSREYAAGPNDETFSGALVGLVAVYMVDHKNRTARHLFHQNQRYAIEEVIQKDLSQYWIKDIKDEFETCLTLFVI